MHTAGPWDSSAQHGGPPSALLGRAMLRCQPRPDMMITRFTCEILRAIPVGEITVAARVARPGRSVELLEATASAGGREVARATAWRVLRTACPAVESRHPVPPPLPEAPPTATAAGRAGVSKGWSDGYMSAMEWRPVVGGVAVPGPATVWMRMRYPLVPDEEPAPLERVLVAADSGNGASWELDISRWLFINPELTVHLHRDPVGRVGVPGRPDRYHVRRRGPGHLPPLRPRRPAGRLRPVPAHRAEELRPRGSAGIHRD